ncbi:MAG: cadherin domain-containing protein [Magnetococcales bacterium]|nr:cadherin domain-containing protein [Magnetococcales bacterium]
MVGYLISVFAVFGDAHARSAKMITGFCNENGGHSSNSLTINNVTPPETKEICIYTKNRESSDLDVEIYFVDGFVNPDHPQFAMCDTKSNVFGAIASFEGGVKTVAFTLKPNEVRNTTATLDFTREYFENNGNDPNKILGCVIRMTYVDDGNASGRVANVIRIGEAVLENNVSAPILDQTGPFTIQEGSPSTTVVGIVSSTDSDTSGESPIYNIVSGNSDGFFEIDPATGEIKISSVGDDNLDFEETVQYVLGIQASDGVNISNTENYTINLTDVNDSPPVMVEGGPFTVTEDSGVGVSVGVISSSDADSTGESPSYSIVSGNADAFFTIDSATGELTVSSQGEGGLDFETVTQYFLEIQASDGINLSTPQSFTIQLTDINDISPTVASAGPFGVAENSEAGVQVGAVSASDADTTGELLSFSIQSGNTDGYFQIDPATGAVSVAKQGLDYEQSSSYSLGIQATDGINASEIQPVVVNLTDLNDNPPVLSSGGPYQILQKSITGTVVGTVSATDQDTTGETTTFGIVDGNSDGYFQIDSSSGLISISVSGDGKLKNKDSFSLGVQGTDGLNVSQTVFYSVDVSNKLDTESDVILCHKPGDPSEKEMTLPESAVDGHLGHGDTLGSCTDSTDEDGQNGNITVSLSVGDTQVTEGNSAQFTVTLSQAGSQEISVAFATQDDTASSPDDYGASSGTVTFTVGETTQTITVPAVDDGVDEMDETFLVSLTNPINATITDDSGTGTILDRETGGEENEEMPEEIGNTNTAPTASGGSLTTDANTVGDGTLAGSDPDGDSLTFSIVSNGSLGSAEVTDTATGAFSYTPNSNADGSDTFTFKVNDGALDSEAATMTVTINAVEEEVDDELIAFYPFNGNANDESGNELHGEANGATLTTDRFENTDSAYSFDGEDDYILVEHDDLLNLSGSFSISLWVYRSDESLYANVLTKGRDCLNSYWYRLGGEQFSVTHGNSWCDNEGISTDLEMDQWVFLTAVVDGVGNTLTLYSNGEVVGNKEISDFETTNSYPLVIGRHFTNSDGSGSYEYPFNGKIDDIRIYGRALSEDEIQELYIGDDVGE